MVARGRDEVRFAARAHGIVLARPFAKTFVLAGIGGVVYSRGWPLVVAGAVLLAAAALVALRAVWRWERTRLVVTDASLAVVQGTVRRRVATVRLDRVGGVRVEQTLLGRLLGYGTLIAGDLAVEHVPRPWDVCRVVDDRPFEPALSA